MNRPWLKFYPSDWRADPALRSCSLAARGLWMEMICVMHEAVSRGELTVGNSPVSRRQLASISGVPLKETNRLLDELEAAGVFSRNGDIIYSRRMKREEEKAARDKANGSRGGNPTLKQGVNPQDKAHILEARSQKEDAASPPAAPASNPEKELFDRGKQVLGNGAGGLIKNLLKAKNGDAALARAAIEVASTKSNPREYVGAIVRAPPPAADAWADVDRVRLAKGSAVVLESEAKIPGLS